MFAQAKDGSVVPAHQLDCAINWCESTTIVPSDVSDSEVAKDLGWMAFSSSGFSQGNGGGFICHLHKIEQ